MNSDTVPIKNYTAPILASSTSDFDINNAVLSNYVGTSPIVDIPAGVTSIGKEAFVYRGDITSVTIPQGVTSIGNMAFFKCSAMTNITIPSTVTFIDSSAFWGCDALTSMNYPGHQVSLADNTIIIDNVLHYYHGSASNYSIPNNVICLNSSAFSMGSNLNAVTIPLSVKELKSGTFDYCYSLTDIYYEGTQEAWNDIKNGAYLWNVCDPTVHFGNKTPAPAGKEAISSPATYLVNGAEKAVASYLIEGNNYIKIRDLASLVSGAEKNFEVTWNEDAKCIEIQANKPYTPVGGEMNTALSATATAVLNTNYPVYFNGLMVDLTSYMIGDNTYFKLRDVMKLVDISVGYDNNTRTVILDSSAPYAE